MSPPTHGIRTVAPVFDQSTFSSERLAAPKRGGPDLGYRAKRDFEASGRMMGRHAIVVLISQP